MNPPLSESEFYSAVTRVAVSQICQTVGCNAAPTSALERLTDIASRYLGAIANSAAASAISGGRTQCNLFDIVVALEDLGSVKGFIGAQEIEESHCLISSSVLKDIMGFVLCSNEIPFAQSIPRKIWPELKKNGNEMGLIHVPRWLPEVPVISGIGMGKEGNEEENLGGEESRVAKGGNGKGKGFELPEKRRVNGRNGFGWWGWENGVWNWNGDEE